MKADKTTLPYPRSSAAIFLLLRLSGKMPRTRFVGQTPWSAADAPVGLLAPCERLRTWSRQRDGGVPRRPGGLPHNMPPRCFLVAGPGHVIGLAGWDDAA